MQAEIYHKGLSNLKAYVRLALLISRTNATGGQEHKHMPFLVFRMRPVVSCHKSDDYIEGFKITDLLRIY